MTNDEEWAAVRPAHRLSYEAFCDDHGRAWQGIARARLHRGDLVERAVHGIRADLRRNWVTVLHQPATAHYGWMTAKRHVAEVALGSGLGDAPPRAVVPDWVVAVQRAHLETRLGLDVLDHDHDHLYAAVLRLPERQHDLIVLRFMTGLEYRTIASYLGLTESSARADTRRGLDKLRRLLGGGAAGSEEMR
ncbi:RNA polymerase sigma factor [Kitasatospora sp. NPDC094028]